MNKGIAYIVIIMRADLGFKVSHAEALVTHAWRYGDDITCRS